MTDQVDPLVSCRWLKEQIDKGLPDNTVICDVSWSSNVSKDIYKEYLSSHIPGAVYVDIMVTEQFTELFPRNKPDINGFQQRVRDAGINTGDHVILYSNSDMNGFFLSGRAWWTFKVFGHEKLSILDGGLKKWLAEGFPVTDAVNKRKPGNFTATLTEKYIRDFDKTQELVEAGDVQICDSRGSEKYTDKAGHIKSSTNIPLQSLMNDEDGTLKSIDSLQKDFSKAAIDLSKPVVTHCSSGMSSCSLSFIALLCGCPDASVYLGGFTEWSNKAGDSLIEVEKEK